LEGLHAAAIAAVGSLITYVPVYAVIFGTSLFNAPRRDLALQAFVHGFLVAVISLVLSWRVKRLSVRGPSPRDNRNLGYSDSRRMASDE
jgi:flagellar biogenesis protein FliO